MSRNTTRYPESWQQVVVPPPTITVSTTATSVTFGGLAGPGNLCGIKANGIGYAYAATATDGPTAVAAALQALVPGATGTGATVNVTPATGLLGRVVGTGTVLEETRRQVQGFLVTCWCPSPDSRDVVAGVVDSALAPIRFLTLADGTGGRLKYQSTFVTDTPSKDALWRRDLVYAVEYPTTLSTSAPVMLWGVGPATAQGVSVTFPPQ